MKNRTDQPPKWNAIEAAMKRAVLLENAKSLKESFKVMRKRVENFAFKQEYFEGEEEKE